MICTKCETDFERSHPAQKYCDECRGIKQDEIIIATLVDNMATDESEVQLSTDDMAGNSSIIYEKIEDNEITAHKELGPLDVYAPERWSKLQGNYEFDPALGRARCKEMSSNIALPSPGDPAYSDTPSGDEMLTFNDLPTGDRFTIERESNAGDPERTREVLIECALKYHRIFGNAHAHEFKR